MVVFGVRLIGLTAQNAHKLLLTVAFVAAILLARVLLVRIVRAVLRANQNERVIFWLRQASAVFTAVLILLAVISIWFKDPSHLAMPIGMVSAGLAFALQKVITSFAGYLVILRGKTFGVRDRIAMGGVRGDVIQLGFIQTTIMEMGQPPPVKEDTDPAIWVQARQYTGRVVTVTNDKVFEEPVYNYTREFPFIWEEIKLPIKYTADRRRAEEILLSVAERFTRELRELSTEAKRKMAEEYFVDLDEFNPRVFYRLTDNWLELTVRFVSRAHAVRNLKDKMSRALLEELERAKIEIASATFEIVGVPALRLELPQQRSDRPSAVSRPSVS